MHVLMSCEFGSSLYGTRTPESDTDYKSVFIPSGRDIILQKANGVISKSTGSANNKNTADDVDNEYFTLMKFFNMLKVGDMIANELLFVPDDKLIQKSPLWTKIKSNRKNLLSSDVAGFVGYCKKQAAKYGIKGTRVASVREVCEYLFSYQYIREQSLCRIGNYWKEWEELSAKHEFVNIIEIVQPTGVALKHLEVCNRRLPYTITVKDAYLIVKKIMDNYGSRALAAEKNEGVDWKAVAHAIRVSEQAIELLETGKIIFPRFNAAELVSIKHGEHSYDIISGRLERNLDKLLDLAGNSQYINNKIDEAWMEETLYEMYCQQVIQDDKFD